MLLKFVFFLNLAVLSLMLPLLSSATWLADFLPASRSVVSVSIAHLEAFSLDLIL